MDTPTIVLRDTGTDDLAIVNAARRARGQPESALRWVCQHSCAEASIPDCSDPSCEAMLVLDDADARLIRWLAEQGDLAPFDAVTLTCRVAAPDTLVSAMLEHSPGIVRAPSSSSGVAILGAAAPVDLRASLLAFARCASRIAAAHKAPPGLKNLGDELAACLRSTYPNGAPALLDERIVERRTRPQGNAALVVFAVRGDWPGIAYVALGTDKCGSTTSYDTAYGLFSERKGSWRFGRLSPGASRETGEFYGPNCRIVVRVERAAQDQIRSIAERYAEPQRLDPVAACLDCFAEIARALNLDFEAPPRVEFEAGGFLYLHAERFLRAVIDRIPL